MKIEIKSLFGGWCSATREQAGRWAENIKNRAANIPSEKLNKYINSRLRGITAEELFKNGR